jgi:phosphotransferase system enzyme I (PtsI)
MIIQRAAPHPVTIRTLDLGADKGLLGESAPVDKQLSPALGLRGVRYCLRHPELFEPQLRAILRAAVHGPVKVMIPMITGIEEVRSVKVILHRCRVDLEAAGYAVPAQLPLGIMIETPAAALSADALAAELDFFSIGTNDLIHYTIAVDRMDERLAYLYQPMHPSILRLIRDVIAAGERAGIEVSMCGEVAGEPLFSMILLGLGLRNFSMSPMSIPAVKDILRRSTLEQARALALEALSRHSGYEIYDWLVEQQRRLFPQTF